MRGVPAMLEAPRLDGALILAEDGSPSWRYAVEPFQDAFKASGMGAAELACMCGWTCDGKGEGEKVTRMLGLRAYSSVKGGRRYGGRARTLSYENAARIARALDLDFVELGL